MGILITLNAIVLLAVVWLSAYKKGYSDALLNRPDKPILKPSIRPHKAEETEEERRQRILNENVENYVGNGKGQVKL